MQTAHWQWMAALAAAAALHLGLALAVFWRGAEDGAEAPGFGGIEIALGAPGGAPGGEERPAQDVLDTAETDMAESADLPVQEHITERPPEFVQPETARPVAESAPQPPPEETVAIEALAPPSSSHVAEPVASPASLPSLAGAEGRAGAAASPDAGSRVHDASAGGIAGAKADYAAILLAWLEQHKEYPRRARARRQEGVVRLFIAVDRQGEVREAYVEDSVGHVLLERAALDMLERARPLPPLPDDIQGERLELVVPVHFYINRGHRSDNRRSDNRFDRLRSSRQ